MVYPGLNTTILLITFMLCRASTAEAQQTLRAELDVGIGGARGVLTIDNVPKEVVVFSFESDCDPPCLIIAIRAPSGLRNIEELLVFLVNGTTLEGVAILPPDAMRIGGKTPWTDHLPEDGQIKNIKINWTDVKPKWPSEHPGYVGPYRFLIMVKDRPDLVAKTEPFFFQIRKGS